MAKKKQVKTKESSPVITDCALRLPTPVVQEYQVVSLAGAPFNRANSKVVALPRGYYSMDFCSHGPTLAAAKKDLAKYWDEEEALDKAEAEYQAELKTNQEKFLAALAKVEPMTYELRSGNGTAPAKTLSAWQSFKNTFLNF